MERKLSKLESRLESELEIRQNSQPAPPVPSFGSVDELLRYDAEQTEPPAHLQERIAQSIEGTGAPVRPWWRRWLGIDKS